MVSFMSKRGLTEVVFSPPLIMLRDTFVTWRLNKFEIFPGIAMLVGLYAPSKGGHAIQRGSRLGFSLSPIFYNLLIFYNNSIYPF